MQRSHRLRLLAAVGVATTACGAFFASAAPAGAASKEPSLDREAIAKALLAHHGKYLSAQAQRALAHVAGLDKPGNPLADEPEGGAAPKASTAVPIHGSTAPRLKLRNIRVNNPAADHYQVDQTTQSETTLAVSGSKIAVGFNDSQHSLLFLTAASNLTGYAYSTNGGKSFVDGGVVPNPNAFVNLGDPWLASDRGGRFYYSTLTLNGTTGNGEVGVALSNNGGKSWTAPHIVSPNNDSLFYFGDRDSMAAGPSGKGSKTDNVYVTWDDFVTDPATNTNFTGLPIARSTNRGATWTLHYLDKNTLDPSGCSIQLYTGAQPVVNHSDGRLYVIAEKISVTDPKCEGGAEPVITQVIFTSTNAGASFTGPVTIAPVSPSLTVSLGAGKLVRTAEFPTMAIYKGKLYLAWQDGARGVNHIRLVSSANRGATWSAPTVLTTGLAEFQPALTADSKGLHLAFYQKNPGNTVDTVLSDSTNGTSWKSGKVTSASFPGVFTAPQFDPVIAPAYMGDYIANVTDGTHTYLAWGDNRDIVKNFLWPSGRHDPDVFFAKR
jgi:hypothetical protein